MGFKHNKKRNVGLISEFFSRYIAGAFIDGRHNDIATARKIWDKHLHPKSETYKEFVLFNALYESNLKSKEVAYSLLNKARDVCKNQSQEVLDAEKAALINEVKATLKDKDFFDRPVSDFKTFASVQVLMNAWRGIGFKGDIADLATLEESVLEHMCTPKVANSLENEAEKLTTSAIDSLVVKLMTEKLNKRYENLLNETQRRMLQLYVFSQNDTEKKASLVSLLEDLKARTLKSVKSPVLTESLDRTVKTKLQEVVKLLEESSYSNIPENLGDDLIAFYMTIAKLTEEVESKPE